MKNIIKFEELGMFCLTLFLFNLLGFSWWLFVIFILAPDISMLGYLVNNKVGAVLYNIFHHKGLAVLIYLIGSYTFNYYIIFTGLIIFGHSSLDRFLGYGLKFSDAFKHTHLGMLGEKAAN
jgi:hypothetical protein